MSQQYSNLAGYYDLLNDSVDYDKWYEFINSILKKNSFSPRSVVDLACGTGQMALRFARDGVETIAIDLSHEMLSIAKSKADAQKLDILFLNQDMADFELYGTVDLIVCCLDSINYLLSPVDVESCFARVKNYLNNGGYFIFDINSEYKFQNIYADNSYIYENENLFCTWQNYYKRSTKICDFYLDFFVKQGGLYKRFSETQRERCYTLRQILKYLNNCDLEVTGIYSDFDCTPVTEKTQGETERFYIVCKKM